jgi:hypothetical protein
MAAINWSAAQLFKLGSPGVLERAAIKLSAGDVIQVSFSGLCMTSGNDRREHQLPESVAEEDFPLVDPNGAYAHAACS